MVLGFSRKQFDAADIPDLTGKVAIVTGGNGGIGAETCLALVRHNARVYMAARSESKATKAIAEIKAKVPTADLIWLKMDLMDLASVKAAAEEFTQRETRLDILINNAGVMAGPHEISKDGFETQFQTNHVGHYLFTRLLLPIIKSTAALPLTSVRIVNVSSLAHYFTRGTMTFETLEDVNQDFGSAWLRYGQSKLANLLFTKALQQRLDEKNIYVNAVHPGLINSGLWSSGNLISRVSSAFGSLTMISPYKGSLTQLYCATSPEIEEKQYRGQFFKAICQHATPTAQAQDQKLADNLWNLSEKVLQEKNLL
ncbi:short chain dehydrogenase [Geranomyces variabilis]|nr:short chain dehydrogenase [Geranomyces variabilis]KAJ3131771.1 hypothetical protein HDU90_007755 [Geranomyces variabilis]